MQRDNIHYNTRKIDSYDKQFNFVVSAREAGKSTSVILDKAYKAYLRGHTTLFIRRDTVSITDEYINSIVYIIEQFSGIEYKMKYTKTSIRTGIVTVYLNDKLFCYIVSLSAKIARLKSLVLPNLEYIIVDEFICNWKYKEKYLVGEVEKFEEIYNTFQRYKVSRYVKTYFLGNPYSRYNPYFLWLNADIEALEPGTIQVGETWAIENYRLSQELYEKILEENPLYKIDQAYTDYALNGKSVNDENINIVKTQPNNFKLWAAFYLQGKYVGIFRSNGYASQTSGIYYYCRDISVETVNSQRDVYCFDLNEVFSNRVMIDKCTHVGFEFFKSCMMRGIVGYESITVFYLLKDIFNMI